MSKEYCIATEENLENLSNAVYNFKQELLDDCKTHGYMSASDLANVSRYTKDFILGYLSHPSTDVLEIVYTVSQIDEIIFLVNTIAFH